MIVATAMLTPTIASAAPVVPDAPSPVPGVESSSPYADDGVTYTADGRPLYESASDTIYIYNALQTAVSRQDDAADQPVLTGDGDAETFGTGQPIYAEDSDEPLTYSPEHTYVYVDGWDEGLEDAGDNNNVVVSDEPEAQEESDAEKDEQAEKAEPVEKNDAAGKDVVETEPTEDSAEKSTESDEVDLLADGDETEAYNSLSGRDYVGQVTKQIGDETYILIGNEQQLRAIGSNKEVHGIVYHRDTLVSEYYIAYNGDADLGEGEVLGDIPSPGLGNNCGVDSTGAKDESASWETGLYYTSNANYIIFRDIDVSSGGDWTPLMFEGVLIGAKASGNETIWDEKGSEITATESPRIIGVNVDVTGVLDTSKYAGVGFFGTISSKMNPSNLGLSGGTTIVDNITLVAPQVNNQATGFEDLPDNLVEWLLSLLGNLASGLLGGVDYIIQILTGAITGTDGLRLGLSDLIKGLLSLRNDDPTTTATGTFAGRVVGDVRINNCNVVPSEEGAQASVTSSWGLTGGFVGYSEGMTEYDGLSGLLKFSTDALETILNAIPGLGLGDLITLLLRNKIIDVSQLIPTGYINPMIENSSVSLSNTTIGTSSSSKNGGFIGEQVGTIILNSQVLTPVTVLAETYAGGFSGVARNGVMKGALSDLGVELIRVAQPQSVTQGCSTVGATVTAGSYAGGFTGALANSYSVNDTIDGSVSAKATSHTVTNEDGSTSTYALAGGFAGAATLGWATDLGSKEAGENNLLGAVNKLLVTLLGGDAGGEGANAGKASTLLSLVGIDNSAILGAQMTGGTIQVESKGNYAGGLLGRGDGVMIAASDDEHLNELDTYDRAEEIGTVGRPTARDNKIEGLQSVTAADSFAGGIAGRVGTASIGGLLNTTLGLGGYLPYEVSDITVSGVTDGYTVEATDGMSAGGGIGEATGGLSKDVELSGVKSVKAVNRAGGFAGVVGPGDLVGTGGLDLLGLGALTVKGLLSVAEGVNVSTENVAVSGVNSGMTVESTGKPNNNEDRSVQYVAGGFIGKANSVQVTTSHVDNLLNVKAADYSGYAGGFVGTSVTGGLADVSDETDLKGLISAGNLLTAVGYLVPTYTDVYASYVDAGGVEAEVAGGFAGDFQSGFINTAWNAEKVAYKAVQPASADYAVYNIDHVKGRLFAGGFGGRVTSGGLASSGDKGGLSILGDIAGLSIDASNLLSLVDAYVPIINYAGVSSTPKGAADDAADDGFTVAATSFDEGVSGSGSAGGYIGYASGAQIGYSDVSTLRHTTVEEPKDLEATSAPSYFDGSSSYAVSAPRYAGGFFGLMDIGNAASLGEGLDVLGNLKLSNVLEALSVVVSTIEHSSVYGAPGGYAVLASGSSANGSTAEENGDLGHAGGFAGLVLGGQIQDANAYNFSHIIGQESAGGYAGTAEPGNVASVLGGSNLLGGLVSTSDALAQLAEDFVPSIRNSETTSVPCGGVVRANAFSDVGNERGMAGGYIGRNEGAQIWGNNTKPWKAATEAYDGPTREAAAWRIRSVYGAEFAGGFTGIMKPAETAETGNLSLLWGLIKVDNALGALGVAYPTEENTAVYGPLRGLDLDTWNSWVKYVGVNGGYGSDLAASGTVDSPEKLEALIANHVYGIDVVAGREKVATAGEANPLKGGSAGGYVGAMIAGTVTNGQAHDVKLVRALRGAGGFAGSAEAGGAATLGTVNLLGIKLNLGALLDAAQVFVPVIKNSSVEGYRMGMTVAATGAGSRNDDITNATGNAGGYIGYGAGVQIWGDGTTELPAEGEGSADQASDADARSTAGCNVSNLRRVQAPAYAGGYAGRLTSGSTANINTDGVSDGFLQGVLDMVLDNANIGDLVSVLQATMSTVRGATVSPADDAWGFTVDAYRADDTVTYPLAAGGFAGSIQATVLGERDANSGSSSALHVEGLRGVDGGLYAGGFVGVAEAGGVAEVAGGTGEGAQTSLLDILKLGNVEVLQAFQPFIYASSVSGSADGITVNAHTWDTGGLLGSKRMSGNAGGFAGTVMSGEVLNSSVEDLNAVSGPNYTGGFVGYTGKSGVADVESVDALDQLGGILGLTAGVANVMGTTVTGCSVEGKLGGYTVSSQGVTGDPEDGGTDASGSTASNEQKAGGFVGYADLAHITDCHATALKLVKSPEVAGGFAGETSFAYLISAEADSALLNAILSVVDQLVKYLYLDDLQHLDAIQLDLLGKALSLDVISDGNVLSVWLLGINISVSLAQGSDIHDDKDDVVKVTIGDSEIKLSCNKGGIVWDADEKAEVTVNLIKGNRSEVTDCSVTGIADGYDVFGGAATQKLDGTATDGYAGGFVGFNNEGKLTGNDMRYADVVRGTADKTGPFTGATAYDSTYWFNDITDIDQNNTYHVYRDPSLVGQTVTGASSMTVDPGAYDTGIPGDTTTATEDNAAWARFDVSGHVPVVGSNHGNWKGATVGGSDIDVYVSAAKAKLMDDASVSDNTGGLTPEPGDGQDPCAERVNVTIQKIWNDGGNWAGKRPGSIKVRLTATYTNNEGATVTPPRIQPTDADGNPVGELVDNPIEVTLTVDDASEWTDTWRKVVENLPVAFAEQVIDADGNQKTVLHYYTYTASEVLFDGQTGTTQDPADSDYMVSIETDGTEKVITITNSTPLPETGGMGTHWFAILGVLIVGVGILLTRKDTYGRGTGRHRAAR
ncbi:LPXTG cell wall anchor domain-containing protein [Bifidobacterium pullorum subsp. gallinarum]|uniref:LPXTG cell wall anchor domain-containing protein n=1 Tax=Bifidobacterium pullorum subsp. gallinarum TaxID=78344 RepID=A0A4P6DU49_9BIFI|nr:LPXTG cell wall anchor domain-containing protein [Bifidobacterium pullorum]QAY33543.1 LPXTG cell wall anchor domain-containing protein [Bifidobacterium pullorum subsp. gallinarum]